MTCLIKWTADTMPQAGDALAPGAGGYMDPPLHPGMQRTPLFGHGGGEVGPLGPTMGILHPTIPASTEFESWIRFEDLVWENDEYRRHNRIEFNLNDEEFMSNPSSLTMPISTYSARFYFRNEGATETWPTPEHHRLVSFCNGHENYSWTLRVTGTDFFSADSNGNPTVYRTEMVNGFGLNVANRPSTADRVAISPAPASGAGLDLNTSAAFYGTSNRFWRIEIQVATGRTANAAGSQSKVIVRFYWGCETTDPNRLVSTTNIGQRLSLVGSPTNVAMDRIYFGDNHDLNYTNFHWMSGFEIHDDFNLGGQFTNGSTTATDAALKSATGAPRRRRRYEFFEYNGPSTPWTPLEFEGEWTPANAVGAKIQPIAGGHDPVNDLVKRDIHLPPSAYEDHGFFFASEDADDTDKTILLPSGQRIALYYPTRTPPINGWPVVLWTHGGFWFGGSYRNLKKAFMKRLIKAGFAVLSVNYKLTNLLLESGAYPAYGTVDGEGFARGARYPSMVVDLKNVANWVRKVGTSGLDEYPLDSTAMLGIGYSAGGYNTLAAAVTEGMTADAHGTNMTIDGNSFGTKNLPGGGDPHFIGAVSCSGPVDLHLLRAGDLTVQSELGYMTALPSGTHISLFEGTFRAFFGQNVVTGGAIPTNRLERAGIPALIAKQLADDRTIPPLMYIHGGSDYLVPGNQPAALTTAMNTHFPDVPHEAIESGGTIHDNMEQALPYHDLIAFLRMCVRRARGIF